MSFLRRVTSRKHLLWNSEMAPNTRKLCCSGSSCLLLLTLSGLQTFLPFAKSSLSHHGAMTNGNKSQFWEFIWMLLWNSSGQPVRGSVCAVTHRGKKTLVLLWKITLSCVKGILGLGGRLQPLKERWASATQPNQVNLQIFLEFVLCIAQCTSHTAAKRSSWA